MEMFEGRKQPSLYDFIRRRWHKDNYKGKFSAEEDEMLLGLVDEHGNNWKKIGGILERMPLNVRDRWREIKENYATGPWSPQENERLLRLVKLIMGEGDLHTLTDVQWEAISSRLQTRSRQQCRTHFTRTIISGSGMQSMNTWLPEDDFELTSRIKASGAEALDEIDWSEVRWTVWTYDQMKKRWIQLVKRVPDYMFKSFTEIADSLAQLCERDKPSAAFAAKYAP